MKKVLEFLQDYWRHIIIGLGIALIGYFVVFHGVMTMLPDYSPQEITAQASSSSLRAIWDQPLNALYKILVWVPFKLGHHSVVVTRLVAGTIALACATLFYFIVYSLFSHRIAILTTILFVTSSGFLHASHVGAPFILQLFGVLALLALIPAYILIRGKVMPVYLVAVAAALLLYIPGLLWFILLGAIVLNKRILQAFRAVSIKHQIFVCSIVLLLLLPLILAYFRQPSLVLASLGLPDSIPSLSEILNRAKSFAKSLFWAGKGPAEIMLVGAPLLNLIEFSLLFIGVCVQFKKPRLKSNFFVLGATLFIALLIIVGGVLNYMTLTPLLYLLMAGGLFYLLTQWHKVFPVNPIAHIVGTALTVGLVATSALFHIHAFYTAWPHSNPTRATFSQHQPTNYSKTVEKHTTGSNSGPSF